MQAGWPSASEFPRGGLQGGGSWNFNEFNLALTKNGRTRHLRGRWNNGNTMNNNNNNNNNNNGNGNTKRKHKTKRRTTSAAPALKKLAFKGEMYETNTKTGATYKNGNYVGTYVRPASGKPYIDFSPKTPEYGPPNSPMSPKTPEYGMTTPPYEYDEVESTKTPKTLTQNGGKPKATRKRKHKKGCTCFFCSFRTLKL